MKNYSEILSMPCYHFSEVAIGIGINGKKSQTGTFDITELAKMTHSGPATPILMSGWPCVMPSDPEDIELWKR
jgi:hypothetical protein